MRPLVLSILIILSIGQLAAGRQVHPLLRFKTSGGHTVKVTAGAIYYDNKSLLKIEEVDVIYDSKSNCLIEDHGAVFLFVAMSGRPNLDRLNAFAIAPLKATLIADAILSPIKDFDGDGYLEFGGCDLTEMYPNPDSMYYIPTAYYEIRDGKIRPDKALTISKDITINGLYLPPNKHLDKDGYCCKVIPTPGRKHRTKRPAESKLIRKSFMGSDTITVFAADDVLTGKAAINYVVHNYDGIWLFYTKNKLYVPEATKKVKLGDIIKIDESVLLLSWLPKGHYAIRSSKTAPWGMNKLGYKE